MRDARQEMEGVFTESPQDDEKLARLEASLHPRGPAMLYDLVAALGTGTKRRALDVGCRDDRHARELASRFGYDVIGIDLVRENLARTRTGESRAQNENAGSTHPLPLALVQASMESIPLADSSVDLIWCRDMMPHVRDLARGLRECARVLRPEGVMVAYLTLATDLLEPQEAHRLFTALGMVPENTDRAVVERLFDGAGLAVRSRESIGSEWRERFEEDGARTTSRQLVRIARMRRARSELVAEVGEPFFEVELADCHWGVYQMLGKLCPTVYTLGKRDGPRYA